MADAGYDNFGGDVVKQVLDVVDAMLVAFPEETVQSVPLIAKLIAGKKLDEEDWSDAKKAEGYVWRPILPRSLQVGAVVRVREDAYDNPERMPHNGKQGKVNAIRSGVYVIYDDADRTFTQMGTHHHVDKLEQRMRRPSTQ